MKQELGVKSKKSFSVHLAFQNAINAPAPSAKQFNLTQHASMKIMLSCLISCAFNPAYALPLGEQVAAGHASFVREAQTLNINQTSQQAIVNWQSFGIAAHETVNVYQPHQGSALFRVLGADPSQIFGRLNATGSLFLINPNGILFAPGAQVDVGSLVASTMQMSDQDFLARRYQFNGGADGSVINKGAIRTEDGGYIVLLGNTVENSGTLIANQGSVVLASAQSALLDVYGDGLVQVKLSGDALKAVVNNAGNINANGGTVQLATNARTAAINVNGVVQANSLVERNGVIRLEGGGNSTVLVSGQLEASGKTVDTKGGYIAVTGERVALLDGTAIDVSGDAGGGIALIGGDYQGNNSAVQNAEVTFVGREVDINADAITKGDAGKLVVWADDTTRFFGSTSARGGIQSGNGGFVEVSGKQTLVFKGDVDTRADNGNTGLLFLDPADITILNGTGDGNDLDALNNSFAGSPSAGIGTVLEADTSPTTMFESELQGIAATTNISLAATGTITINDLSDNNLNLAQGSGNSVTFSSAVFTMNTGDRITTAGGAININTTGAATIGSLAATGGAVTLNVGGVSSVAGVISGTGTTLTKEGSGTLTLSGANTYTGTTNINAGTLIANNNAALGTTAGGTIVASGATLAIQGGRTIADALTISGNGVGGTAGALRNISSNNTYTGAITLGAGGARINSDANTLTLSGAAATINGAEPLTVGGAGATTISKVIATGAGSLTKEGAGTLTLSGANTYTGTTTINAGTLTMGANNVFANTSSILVNGGTLNANTRTDTVAGVRLDSGAITGTTGALTSTTDFDLRDGTVSKILGGAVAVNKTTAGTVTLSGANTYTGTTNINAGTLIANNNAALGTTAGGTIVASGATLAIQGTRTIADALTISGNGVGGTAGALRNISSNNNYTGAITIGAGGARINSDANTLTLSGAGNITGAEPLTVGGAGATTISKVIATGAGSLTKEGIGTLTLSGANTYTGTTNINAGTLIANNNAALGTTAGGTIVASGATLAIQGGRTIADALTISGNGVGGTAGALRNISSNNTYTGAITLGAGGARINSDANTLTLSGAGNITGAEPLAVSGAGATTISKVIATGAGSLTKEGAGTLTLSGVNTYTGATTINAGTLTMGANNVFADTSSILVNGGTLNANNRTDTVAGVRLDSGAITGTTGALTSTTDFDLRDGTVSKILGGAVAVNKTTAGTVTLSGTNTYTGTTNINAGTLSVASANALGSTANGTAVASGATLNVNNVTLAAEALTLNGTGVSGTGALTGTGNATVSGAVSTASASNIGTTSVGSTLTLNGVMTATAGTGNLGIVGAGNVTATNAANNFNTVNINGANNVSLRDSNGLTIGNGASNLTGNLTVRAGGNITVANDVTTTGGDITLAGTNFINTAGPTALNASGRWLVYSTTPGSNTFGGLLSGNQAIWNATYPTAIVQTGNRYVFSSNPVLTVTSTNQSKTYGQDGSPTVANAYSVTGFVNASTFGDVFTQDTAANTLTGSAISTGSNVNANVGSYAINVSPVNAVTGYTLIKNSSGLLTVNPATLTITANDQANTYGQTFSFAGTEFTSTGLQNGETIATATLVSAGSSSTANVVGSPYAITASNAAGGTFNAGNYTISYVDGAMTVNPAIVSISGSRSYNGTTAFNGSSFGAVSGVLGQTLNLSGTASVASGNAGAAQTLSLDSLVLADGTGLASNYTLIGGTNTGTINQANITVSTANVIKTYDGNTSALGTATITSGTLFNNASNGGTLDSLSGGSFAYTDKNADTGNKTVTVGAVTVNDGNGGGNYQVTYANNSTSTINKADITAVTGMTAADKVYDGNTDATLNTTAAHFIGIVAGETLTVGTATGTFNSKDVLTANTVNINGITLADGADLASNYNLTNNTATTAANITAKDITAVTGMTAADKVYDGNTDATLNTTAANFIGIVAGETLTVGTATGTFNSKDVLTANTVNINGIALADGADLASNYNLTSNAATASASITPRSIAVTADPGQSKPFGSADPSVYTYSIGGLGMVNGETLSGFLIRNPGEIAGNYAINQGTLAASPNYAFTYIGNNFTILTPPTSPRVEAGLVDLNPALGNYTSQQLFVLNLEAPAAGNGENGNQSNAANCTPAAEPLAKDKDFVLMLNFGLKLPKGINTTCI